MSFEATKKPKKLIPQGLQPARCFAIIDIGTHLVSFKGTPTLDKDSGKQLQEKRIIIFWEVPKYMITYKEGDKPQPSVISQVYSLSAGKKAKLPDVLKSWGPMKERPAKISKALLSKFVGHLCMINVEHSKNGEYANVGGNGRGINPFMKEIAVPVKCKEPVLYDMDEFTWDSFGKLPPYAQTLMRSSLEFPKIAEKLPEPIKQDSVAEFQNDELAEEPANDIVTGDSESEFQEF